ncbi:MAG: hypothetical protein IPL32_05985 [Chloracidobacterium sp.]|nr:hypothetical protein [Chloracidobacterium sp.]
MGKIETVKLSKQDHQTVTVNIEKTFKGYELKQMVLNQPQLEGCGVWDFSDDVGKTMLLYVGLHRKTKRYVALSYRGGPVERMSEELYWLNGLPMSLKRTRIAGTIELYTESVANYVKYPFEFIKNIAGIKVKVFSDKNSYELVTDKNGVYEIWDIPVGKYKVEAVLPPDLIPHLEMEKGPIDGSHRRSLYDSLGFLKENTKYSVLFDIQPNRCAGIDFIVNQKTK